MKKRIVFSVALGLAVLIFALPAFGGAKPEPARKVLKIGQVGDLASLEPFRNATPNYLFIENIFDQLLYNEQNKGFQSEILEKWQVAPDSKSVKLQVRDGVVSHDGSPVDAEMIRFLYQERGRNAAFAGSIGTIGKHITSIDVLDRLTLVLNFSIPIPNLESELTITPVPDPDTFVKDDGSIAKYNACDKQVGTGAFKVVEHVAGSHYYWEKFDGYWDKGLPKLDRIEITFFGDPASMIAALESGEIDFAYLPPYQELARLSKSPKYTAWVPKTQGLSTILMVNPSRAPLGDKRVRQAISYAINREAINEAVFSGFGVPSGAPTVKTNFAYSPEMEIPTKGDPARAKELLKEAGNPKVAVKLTYGSTSQTDRLISEIVQQNLKDVGITVELDPQEQNTYIQMRTSQNFDMMPSVMGGTNGHPANLQNSFVFIPERANHGFFKEKSISEYDNYVKYFNQAVKAAKEADAAEAWRNALLSVQEGAWVLFLVGQPYVAVSTSRMKGFTWTEMDKPIFRYVYFED